MEQGLAQQMVYGNGEGQNTAHYYAGSKKKTKSCGCSSKKRKKTKAKSGCKRGCGS